MQILHGDCLALLPTLPANSIDAIVTDPPAGISFMGREWDKDKGGRDHWIAWMQQVAAECLRCIKPGGHALVWALPRTSHWTATAWENAGWEVRDIVHHVFGSGFPKSRNVSKAIDVELGAARYQTGRGKAADGTYVSTPGRDGAASGGYNGGYGDIDHAPPATPEAQQWQGWGTALKPAVENWILLRKPLIGTVAQNVLTHGTGALNIDASRVPGSKPECTNIPFGAWRELEEREDRQSPSQTYDPSQGRWPPNLLLDGSDEVVECFPSLHGSGNKKDINTGTDATYDASSYHVSYAGRANRDYGGASGSAARFFPSLPFTDDERRVFYCAKASRKDRNGSQHPTIKPIKLIEWLCRLITPPGGTILDPFAGSGTTGQAAINLGFEVILIEREDEYVKDIHNRNTIVIGP